MEDIAVTPSRHRIRPRLRRAALVSAPTDRYRPRAGDLYVVRWLTLDGQAVNHKYYRRRLDAEAFLHKLRRDGRNVRMYSTTTAWTARRPPRNDNR